MKLQNLTLKFFLITASLNINSMDSDQSKISFQSGQLDLSSNPLTINVDINGKIAPITGSLDLSLTTASFMKIIGSGFVFGGTKLVIDGINTQIADRSANLASIRRRKKPDLEKGFGKFAASSSSIQDMGEDEDEVSKPCCCCSRGMQRIYAGSSFIAFGFFSAFSKLFQFQT